MRISGFLELPTDEAALYQAMTFDTTHEEDKAIANCINHADALADALAIVLEAYFSKGGVTTDIAASALESLKAYVGEDK